MFNSIRVLYRTSPILFMMLRILPGSLDLGKFLSVPLDPEEVAMEEAIIGKLAVALYSAGLETYLTQATEAEAEAEWWADVEGSRGSVALYLLQSMILIFTFFLPCC